MKLCANGHEEVCFDDGTDYCPVCKVEENANDNYSDLEKTLEEKEKAYDELKEKYDELEAKYDELLDHVDQNNP